MSLDLRQHAQAIWHAAVAAADPVRAVQAACTGRLRPVLAAAERIIVVGAGKAGSTMALAVETALADQLDRVTGWVNVPAGTEQPTQRIRLHAARPVGSNRPTAEGVVGSNAILQLVASAGPRAVVLCLISGGGSALLPAPVAGVTLEDKQTLTHALAGSGATIREINAVRKHLSRIKGGRLAECCTAQGLYSLIISDVVGDPLDVIASGPTALDPTTFADALAVLDRYRLEVPARIRAHLDVGVAGQTPETPKELSAQVHNQVIGSNSQSLAAAQSHAEQLGYRVLNLGAFIEGETREVAIVCAGVVRSIRAEGVPLAPPACVLLGGETTVTLGATPGQGGRNQEFALAVADQLGTAGLANVCVLSGGTDGEDGPTDAAGAWMDATTWATAQTQGLNARTALAQHNAYPYFAQCGSLLRTGLTGTNVMDVRVVLIG